MEYLNIVKILSYHCYILWSRFRNLSSVVFRLIWPTNFYKEKCYISNNIWSLILHCTFYDIFYTLQIFIWYWNWNCIPTLQKIYLIDNSNLKSFNFINKAQNLLCYWLFICLCRCMVLTVTSSMAFFINDNLPTRHVCAILNQSKWQIKS